jgi:hypothetical protein
VKVTHDQKWQVLLHKPIALLPSVVVHKREQHSRLMLPGYATWPVLGGSFTVEKVGHGFNLKTPLNGTIEIRCETRDGEKTYRGTFAVLGATYG